MKFTVLDHDQRTPEWYAARLGRLTGSRASDMMAQGKGGAEAAVRRNLRVQLVLERITGRSHENRYVSAAMQQGIDREPDAQLLYEILAGRLLARTGFIAADDHMVGCSLDGHVGDFEGIIELKCPIAATHLAYLRSGSIPNEYMLQVVHGLWVTGARWCDWMSYNPDFPEPLQARLVRVWRDEQAVASYGLAANLFLSHVAREVDEVRRLAVALREPAA